MLCRDLLESTPEFQDMSSKNGCVVQDLSVCHGPKARNNNNTCETFRQNQTRTKLAIQCIVSRSPALSWETPRSGEGNHGHHTCNGPQREQRPPGFLLYLFFVLAKRTLWVEVVQSFALRDEPWLWITLLSTYSASSCMGSTTSMDKSCVPPSHRIPVCTDGSAVQGPISMPRLSNPGETKGMRKETQYLVSSFLGERDKILR